MKILMQRNDKLLGGFITLAIAMCLLFASVIIEAQDGLITRDEALAIIFPEAEIESKRVFLTVLADRSCEKVVW